MKDQQKEQAKRDKANLISSAYGLQPLRSSAPTMESNEMLQGLFAGAQLGLMNENLWLSAEDKAAKEARAAQLAAQQAAQLAAQQAVVPLPAQATYDPYAYPVGLGGTI